MSQQMASVAEGASRPGLRVQVGRRDDFNLGLTGLDALAEAFTLDIQWVVVPPHAMKDTVWPIERVYRALDRELDRRRKGGRRVSPLHPEGRKIGSRAATLVLAGERVVTANEPVLEISFDGLPFGSLWDAVRARLGVAGGMMQTTIWEVGTGVRKPILTGWCGLDHRSLSISVDWITAKLPALVSGALARIGAGQISALVSEDTRFILHQKRSAASLIGAMAIRFARRLVGHANQWAIRLYATQPNQRWPMQRASTIELPSNAHWADPFLLSHEGHRWLLFEEQPLDSPRGHIAALELDAAGLPAGPACVVLNEPWHLSYPFIWREPHRLCMIPESSANRSVNLYQADRPTGPWRKTATLITGRRLMDATVVAFGGRLWMFAAGASERGCGHDELHLFWSHRIEGPWHAHALNPVKIDARSARPAGAMWVNDGVLYRVAQDCSSVYGGAVTRLRVDELTPERFDETVLKPDDAEVPFEPGCPWHTLNADNDMLVIDVLRRRLRWPLHR